LQAITLVQVVKSFLATARLNDRPGGSKGPPELSGVAQRADTMEKIPNGYPPA
jgi:hypothetical protein